MEIALRVKRPCLLLGKPTDAGQVVRVPIAEASLALDGGRVELDDPSEKGAVDLHRRAETGRALGPSRREDRVPWLRVAGGA